APSVQPSRDRPKGFQRFSTPRAQVRFLPGATTKIPAKKGVFVLYQVTARDERLELSDHLRVAAELEVGANPLLQHQQSPLGQRADRLLEARLERERGERLPAPQRECLAQRLRALGQPLATSVLDEALEPRQVELLRINVQHVARRLELDRSGAEEPPQL